jgi:hypothetical protein
LAAAATGAPATSADVHMSATQAQPSKAFLAMFRC